MQYSKSSQFIISNLILLFILSFSSYLFAGAPDTLWTRTYSGAGDDFGTSVQQTSDGGFIIVGYTYSFEAGDWDVYLIRTSSNGDTLWTKTYGGTENDGGSSIQITRDGGFIIAGYTTSFGAGLQDIYLIRTNSDGDTLWTKTYGRDLNELNGQVKQTSDDGFIIVGTTEPSVVGEADVYLIRTDLNGDTLWTKTYGGNEDDCAGPIVKTEDGGFVIAGHTLSFGSGGRDVFLLKIDSIGDTLWTKTYGGIKDDRATSIDQVSDGGFIITGTTDSYGAGYEDIYLLRIDSNGDTLWSKAYGGSGDDFGISVQYTSDDKFIITGSTNSFGAGKEDVYTICTDLDGNILWSKTIGGNDRDFCYSTQQTSDGGFIIVGGTSSFGDTISDVYLIRLDKDTTGIQEEIPSNFLNPNDFIVSYNNNNLISIRYTIQYPSSVNLSMYNISGQLIKTLFNEYKNAGEYTINFKTDNISAGVYYFKLLAGESSYTRKAVVVE